MIPHSLFLFPILFYFSFTIFFTNIPHYLKKKSHFHFTPECSLFSTNLIINTSLSFFLFLSISSLFFILFASLSFYLFFFLFPHFLPGFTVVIGLSLPSLFPFLEHFVWKNIHTNGIPTNQKKLNDVSFYFIFFLFFFFFFFFSLIPKHRTR